MEFKFPLENIVVPDKYIMAAIISGAVSKLLGLALVSRKQQQLAGEFELVGKVSDLMIHPVKACRCIHTKDALVTDVGLEKDGLTDRHWMIFAPDGKHFNMRWDSRLTLVKSQDMGDKLRLTAPGMEPLDLLKNPDLKTANILMKKVMDQPIKVVYLEEATEWFRTYLKKNVQFAFSCQELSSRDVSTHVRQWDNTVRKRDKTIFGFLTSYLLTTTASLKVINDQLNKPVLMDNFRSNIVVDNSIPFDEDNWDEIRIGNDLLFHSVEPCLSFRCRPPYGHAPVFGVYISNDGIGRIQVGDPVYARRKPPASRN